MAVEQDGLDPGIRQEGDQEGQPDGIIRCSHNTHEWIVSRMAWRRNRAIPRMAGISTSLEALIWKDYPGNSR